VPTRDDLSGFRGVLQNVAAGKLSQSIGRTFMAATTDIASAKEGLGNHGFFTYVLLEAFGRGDEDNNGLIEICEVAKYVATQLPLKANFKRQVPRIKVIGSDFALLNRLDIADINRLLNTRATLP
jgi:hypothetical protein